MSATTCDNCSANITHSLRYHCSTCPNFDFCPSCLELYEAGRINTHPADHLFLRLHKPHDHYANLAICCNLTDRVSNMTCQTCKVNPMVGIRYFCPQCLNSCCTYCEQRQQCCDHNKLKILPPPSAPALGATVLSPTPVPNATPFPVFPNQLGTLFPPTPTTPISTTPVSPMMHQPASMCSPIKVVQLQDLPSQSNHIHDIVNVLSELLWNELPPTMTFISPFSIVMAFLLLLNGTDKKVHEEIRRVFRILPHVSTAEINEASRILLLEYAALDVISIANGIFTKLSHGMQFSPHFQRLVDNCYDAQSDVTNDVNRINEWVAEKTKQKIRNLLSYMPDFVLVNTVYFKSNWKKAFPMRNTRSEPFTSPTGERILVQLMRQTDDFHYFENEALQAIRLPYQDNRFEAMIILPSRTHSTTIPPLSTVWTLLSTTCPRPKKGEIALPKFKVSCKENLIQPLSQLGMHQMVTPSGDYAPMIAATHTIPLMVTTVMHQVVVEVEEMGTVAAAATAIGARFGGMPAVIQPFRMICDRPFHFVIVDRMNGMCLFRGHVTEPTF